MSRKKYKLSTVKSKKTGNNIAFKYIKAQIKKKPASLLALAAGRTTDGLHKLISNSAKKNPHFWRQVKVLQIDEIVGAKPTSSLSFNFELNCELKDLFKIIKTKNVCLINGNQNFKKTISNLKKFISKNKGIDLITLGIGPHYDPHIAYNTKGKAFLNSSVHVVKLHPKTARNIKKRIKEKKGGIKKSFKKGVTLGIKDILGAKKAILLAYGEEKSRSLDLAFNKNIDVKNVPGSALQLHKNLYIVTDKLAGKCLVK